MKNIFRVAFVAFFVVVASTAIAQPIKPITPVKPAEEVKYQGEFNVSYGVSIKDDFRGIIDLETIHGVRVGNNISVGLGVGLNLFKDYHVTSYGGDPRTLYLMPVFVDIKWYFLDQKISPFFVMDMGCSLDVQEGRMGSYQDIYFAAGGGASFRLKEKTAINVSIYLKDSNLFVTSGIDSNIVTCGIKAGIVF